MNDYQLPSTSLLKTYQPDYAFLPNANFVSMHSVISSNEFQNEQSMALPIVLGRSLDGKVQMMDLAKTHHLLVAGLDFVFSDLSYCLNSIIVPLIFKKKAEEVQFVDLGSSHLKVYSNWLRPYFYRMRGRVEHGDSKLNIVSSLKQTIAITLLDKELDRRFELLELHNCNNIDEYNSLIDNSINKLPYLVVIAENLLDYINDWKPKEKDMVMPILRKLLEKAPVVGVHIVFYEWTIYKDVRVLKNLLDLLPYRIAYLINETGPCNTIIGNKDPQHLGIDNGNTIFYDKGGLTHMVSPFMEKEELVALGKHIKEQI